MNLATLDWPRLRQRVCLDPNSIYFNSGSYSPLPVAVYERLTELRGRLSRSPTDFLWRQMPALIDAARHSLAEYLNVAAGNLLLLPNATYAINTVVQSLRLPPGAEIVFPILEYGAMRFCWQRMAAQSGLVLREIEIPHGAEDPAEIVAALRDALSPRTAVLYFSHVTSPTGLVLPAKELCDLAAERRIPSIVDGAHAPGMIPLDLGTLGADFYAGNCHKWVMAPTGAAFLHMKPALRNTLAPIMTSWGWDYDPARAEEDSGWGGSFWARNFEFQGSQDRCAMLVLPEVFAFRSVIGESNLHRRVDELVAYLRPRLSDLGLRPGTPANRRLSGSMTAFEVPAVDLIKARDWLWHERHIEAPFTQAVGKTFLRVSTAWFNTEAEIDRLVAAMRIMPFAELK